MTTRLVLLALFFCTNAEAITEQQAKDKHRAYMQCRKLCKKKSCVIECNRKFKVLESVR